MPKRSTIWRVTGVSWLIAGLFFMSGCDLLPRLTPAPTTPTPSPQSLPPEFNTLWEAWHVLSQGYVDKEALDPDKLSQAAIKGMVDALEDPYTAYMDSTHYQTLATTLRGTFDGIGVEIAQRDGRITVVSPFVGSPAIAIGIRAGDVILEVDGRPTEGMSTLDVAMIVRGPRGTTVRLLVLHPGDSDPVELEVVRDTIELVSVSYRKMDNLGYIRIGNFAENTDEELEPLLRQALSDGVSGLILDLRDNPGGYLDVTTSIASQFLKEGIVYSQLESDGTKKDQPAHPGGLATDLPMVALVNEGSSSASEVLAAALQDNARAPLIGTTTFGKGTANTVAVLGNGGALYYAIARWLTPQGRLIEGIGLTPDIEMSRSTEDIAQGRDPQLDSAVEYLESRLKAPATA